MSYKWSFLNSKCMLLTNFVLSQTLQLKKNLSLSKKVKYHYEVSLNFWQHHKARHLSAQCSGNHTIFSDKWYVFESLKNFNFFLKLAYWEFKVFLPLSLCRSPWKWRVIPSLLYDSIFLYGSDKHVPCLSWGKLC